MFVCIFLPCTHKLYSSCTRVQPLACLAGASFSLYFIQETFTQTYSKWCISGGPHRWALPPHLYRVCLFPPGNDFQSSFAVNHWLRGYFLSFSCHFQLLVVKCLCWQCMVVPAEWKKKALGNSTIFAQLSPNQTDNSACFKEAMVLQSTASKNQTELKLSVHKAGKCRSIAGFFLVTAGYGVQVSLPYGWKTMVGFRMDRKVFFSVYVPPLRSHCIPVNAEGTMLRHIGHEVTSLTK